MITIGVICILIGIILIALLAALLAGGSIVLALIVPLIPLIFMFIGMIVVLKKAFTRKKRS